ncbi:MULTISPECIES: non-ribosomal peptide synthetase/type I polyketide synthase [unclassified Streptomyces]|uniref:non-ribosomal peptide synthetase/type I polyketide synthase n=1 Tax=unclassified Streptomyces TaxID=2593676 RepID=UPI002ED3D37B|nr:amino acid adenylation domain-containing protein [Streptomyces sp. NBC_00891]WSY03968.1 amino acid adenylation domain-containing protein [Streptomyces sp. NBC_00890]WSZ05594.1 amino acid adenylation domain-containing protein [Streptomyces sp. NBC_00869]WSZ26910.1 amino acid adenylation domain-containing protein [Streptomyces sp. NBC_00870]
MIDDNSMPADAVAVVGMALRVPGAETLEQFWDNVRGGVESIRFFTDEELLAAGVTAQDLADPAYVKAFGALEGVGDFDLRFFGFSPREAQMLDPQHRLFLECAWRALEHAGCPADPETTVTGVYAGVGESSYLHHNLLANEGLVERIGAFQSALGNDKDFMPTRVSYKLDLRGPSVSVQTGCSTSLVAVHLASQALINGECDVALAGGATVNALQQQGYRYEEGGVLSPDGHCRAFADDAGGAVPASGCGVVVLKRLDKALADGDVIHAVIRGTAINNDGSRKVGFTAPSVDGQADAVAEALSVAEVDPSTVTYVEAHGTGTRIGDPIEVAALHQAFGHTGADHRCALGSVKTNIGHLDTAAGVVGLIKAALAMRARELPPSLHCPTPNPGLALGEGPFYVNTELAPWPGDVLRAGVSSFGIGGTNAHVVLEEAPLPSPAGPGRGGRHVLPLSAATPTALGTAAAELAAHLRSHPQERLDDVAYTLQRGRRTLPYRRSVVAGSHQEAAEALTALGPARHAGPETDRDREVVLAFPGQGAQRVDMGRALYECEPVFRTEVDRAAGILLPVLGEDLRGLLYPAEADRETARERIGQTEYAQPCLFVVEYALATLWDSWGIRPAAMIGHSLGELVAACLAGVVSYEDALRLVAVRGRLMAGAPAGVMAAVPLPEDEVTPLLGTQVVLAAVNGPRECVVSGPFEAVAAVEARLAESGVTTKRLRTSHAFHSRMMDDAADAFEAEAARVGLTAPRIPFVSNVTGTWITDEEATSPAYWARQLRSTVRFGDGLRTVCRPDALLLEVGPGGVLTSLARGSEGPHGAVASLPSATQDTDAEQEVLTAAGELWRLGAPLVWEALHGGETPRRTVLPTYPFERERCWIDPPRSGPRTARANPDGLAVRGFRTAGPAIPAATRQDATPATWLVVADGAGALHGLADRLHGTHRRTVEVPAGAVGTEDDCARYLASSFPDDERIAGVIHMTLLGTCDEARTSRATDELEAWERALAARDGANTRLVTVTCDALDVTGEEPLVPCKGALTAWARSGRAGSRILLDVSAPGSAAAVRRLSDALLAELDGTFEEPVVAFRGAHRFVPELTPLAPVPGPATARHIGATYAPVGDGRIVAAFTRALSSAGATVNPLSAVREPAAPNTVLLLLDACAPRHQVLETLERATAEIARIPEGAVRGCEVHLVGDDLEPSLSPVAAQVEAHVALARREPEFPWSGFVWSHADPGTAERWAARVVGAAPGGCQAVVEPAAELAKDLVPPVPDAATESCPEYADDIERQVAAVFIDLLGVPDVTPDSNFFELGGHSLLAAQFVAQARTVCGAEVPLRAFVAEPTIRGLAGAVRTALAEAGDTVLEALPSVVPDPANEGVPFPLTDVQQAYWIGRTGVFEIGNVGMHGYEEFDVQDLDLPRMEHAFRRLIQRHGMLRVVVLPHGEQQILTDVPDYVIEAEDLRGLPGNQAHAALEDTRAAMSHQNFQADRWPLFELRASVLDGGRTRLHYSIDGLVTDARASNVLLRELAHLYERPDVELPPLELSFRDYVLAEKSLESSELYRRAEDYWKERIPGLALAPELPLACDPRSVDSPRFKRVEGTLPREAWQRLKGSASQRGITPTALLLAAYSEALATWSKNRHFTLNLPMANRLPLHSEVDAIVGDFTSVTLLEVDAVREATFEARACAVRDRLITDIDHRLFSGVRVIREMKKVRGDAAAAMPVVFTSLFLDHGQDTPIGEVAYSISQTPQVWIDAQVYEVDGALAFDIDAVEQLFPEGLTAAIHSATLELLEWLARDEENWSRPAPLLVPRTELAALEAYNRTEGPLPSGLLHAPFFATAARMPERTAVVTPGRTLSYGELAARAGGIARRLTALGVRPNDLVAVVMEKGWEQCAAVLGILAAGAAYLPVDPELPDERVRLLLEHGQARAILTQRRVAERGEDRFAGVPAVFRVDELPWEEDAADGVRLDGPATPEDLAYVIFTSGSTGRPKGVMIDHRGALNTVADVNERFGVGADDRILALSSLSFDLSVYDVFGPLAVGGAVVMPDASAHRDPAAWLDLMEAARVTLWNSVPALMELLVEHMSVKEARGSALRLVLLSGDWLPVTLPDRIRQVLGAPEVVSLGGATEASIWSILYPIGEVPADWPSIPYGRPMRNQTFHVFDDELRPRPAGVPGQLYIGGVGLAQGYLRDEARTKAAFVLHPETGRRLYRTGDLGRFLPSGDIEFLGREDFQVKVQGYRIELGEIEAAITQHPDVRAAVTVVHGEPRGAKRLIAFVVPQAAHGLPQDLRDFLGTKLPRYMVPDVYVETDALPLTANGKVDRRALVVPEQVAEEAAPHYEAPRTPVEEAVAEVWTNMLKVERVGIHDNFFALGGDSLMAMRAVVHLRKALGTELPIRVLFDNETLEDTALVIEDHLLAEIEELTEEEAQALLAD